MPAFKGLWDTTSYAHKDTFIVFKFWWSRYTRLHITGPVRYNFIHDHIYNQSYECVLLFSVGHNICHDLQRHMTQSVLFS